MKKQQGFTLIELLLVLAVISVMMVVAMSLAQNKSKEMKATQVVQQFLAIENAALTYYTINQTPQGQVPLFTWPTNIQTLIAQNLLSSLDQYNPWGSSATSSSTAFTLTTSSDPKVPALLIYTMLPAAITNTPGYSVFFQSLINQIPYAIDTTGTSPQSQQVISQIQGSYGVTLNNHTLAALVVPPAVAPYHQNMPPLILEIGLMNPGAGQFDSVQNGISSRQHYMDECQAAFPHFPQPLTVSFIAVPTKIVGAGSLLSYISAGKQNYSSGNTNVSDFPLHAFNVVIVSNANGWIPYLKIQLDHSVQQAGDDLINWAANQQLMYMVVCVRGTSDSNYNSSENAPLSQWPN